MSSIFVAISSYLIWSYHSYNGIRDIQSHIRWVCTNSARGKSRAEFLESAQEWLESIRQYYFKVFSLINCCIFFVDVLCGGYILGDSFGLISSLFRGFIIGYYVFDITTLTNVTVAHLYDHHTKTIASNQQQSSSVMQELYGSWMADHALMVRKAVLHMIRATFAMIIFLNGIILNIPMIAMNFRKTMAHATEMCLSDYDMLTPTIPKKSRRRQAISEERHQLLYPNNQFPSNNATKYEESHLNILNYIEKTATILKQSEILQGTLKQLIVFSTQMLRAIMPDKTDKGLSEWMHHTISILLFGVRVSPPGLLSLFALTQAPMWVVSVWWPEIKESMIQLQEYAESFLKMNHQGHVTQSEFCALCHQWISSTLPAHFVKRRNAIAAIFTFKCIYLVCAFPTLISMEYFWGVPWIGGIPIVGSAASILWFPLLLTMYVFLASVNYNIIRHVFSVLCLYGHSLH